jgi:hypothetical protein
MQIQKNDVFCRCNLPQNFRAGTAVFALVKQKWGAGMGWAMGNL